MANPISFPPDGGPFPINPPLSASTVQQNIDTLNQQVPDSSFMSMDAFFRDTLTPSHDLIQQLIRADLEGNLNAVLQALNAAKFLQDLIFSRDNIIARHIVTVQQMIFIRNQVYAENPILQLAKQDYNDSVYAYQTALANLLAAKDAINVATASPSFNPITDWPALRDAYNIAQAVYNNSITDIAEKRDALNSEIAYYLSLTSSFNRALNSINRDRASLGISPIGTQILVAPFPDAATLGLIPSNFSPLGVEPMPTNYPDSATNQTLIDAFIPSFPLPIAPVATNTNAGYDAAKSTYNAAVQQLNDEWTSVVILYNSDPSSFVANYATLAATLNPLVLNYNQAAADLMTARDALNATLSPAQYVTFSAYSLPLVTGAPPTSNANSTPQIALLAAAYNGSIATLLAQQDQINGTYFSTVLQSAAPGFNTTFDYPKLATSQNALIDTYNQQQGIVFGNLFALNAVTATGITYFPIPVATLPETISNIPLSLKISEPLPYILDIPTVSAILTTDPKTLADKEAYNASVATLQTCINAVNQLADQINLGVENGMDMTTTYPALAISYNNAVMAYNNALPNFKTSLTIFNSNLLISQQIVSTLEPLNLTNPFIMPTPRPAPNIFPIPFYTDAPPAQSTDTGIPIIDQAAQVFNAALTSFLSVQTALNNQATLLNQHSVDPNYDFVNSYPTEAALYNQLVTSYQTAIIDIQAQIAIYNEAVPDSVALTVFLTPPKTLTSNMHIASNQLPIVVPPIQTEPSIESLIEILELVGPSSPGSGASELLTATENLLDARDTLDAAIQTVNNLLLNPLGDETVLYPQAGSHPVPADPNFFVTASSALAAYNQATSNYNQTVLNWLQERHGLGGGAPIPPLLLDFLNGPNGFMTNIPFAAPIMTQNVNPPANQAPLPFFVQDITPIDQDQLEANIASIDPYFTPAGDSFLLQLAIENFNAGLEGVRIYQTFLNQQIISFNAAITAPGFNYATDYASIASAYNVRLNDYNQIIQALMVDANTINAAYQDFPPFAPITLTLAPSLPTAPSPLPYVISNPPTIITQAEQPITLTQYINIVPNGQPITEPNSTKLFNGDPVFDSFGNDYNNATAALALARDALNLQITALQATLGDAAAYAVQVPLYNAAAQDFNEALIIWDNALYVYNNHVPGAYQINYSIPPQPYLPFDQTSYATGAIPVIGTADNNYTTFDTAEYWETHILEVIAQMQAILRGYLGVLSDDSILKDPSALFSLIFLSQGQPSGSYKAIYTPSSRVAAAGPSSGSMITSIIMGSSPGLITALSSVNMTAGIASLLKKLNFQPPPSVLGGSFNSVTIQTGLNAALAGSLLALKGAVNVIGKIEPDSLTASLISNSALSRALANPATAEQLKQEFMKTINGIDPSLPVTSQQMIADILATLASFALTAGVTADTGALAGEPDLVNASLGSQIAFGTANAEELESTLQNLVQNLNPNAPETLQLQKKLVGAFSTFLQQQGLAGVTAHVQAANLVHDLFSTGSPENLANFTIPRSNAAETAGGSLVRLAVFALINPGIQGGGSQIGGSNPTTDLNDVAASLAEMGPQSTHFGLNEMMQTKLSQSIEEKLKGQLDANEAARIAQQMMQAINDSLKTMNEQIKKAFDKGNIKLGNLLLEMAHSFTENLSKPHLNLQQLTDPSKASLHFNSIYYENPTKRNMDTGISSGSSSLDIQV